MKEFEKKDKARVAIQQQKQQKQEVQISKRLSAHAGHTLFEIDALTGEVQKALFNHEESAYIWRPDWKPGDKIVGQKSLIQKQGCEYVLALNIENARKNFEKGFDGNKFTNKNPLKLWD